MPPPHLVEHLGAVIHKRYRVYRKWQAGLPKTTCSHTFRATGITTYQQNGGTIEHAQQIVRSADRLPRVAAYNQTQ